MGSKTALAAPITELLRKRIKSPGSNSPFVSRHRKDTDTKEKDDRVPMRQSPKARCHLEDQVKSDDEKTFAVADPAPLQAETRS